MPYGRQNGTYNLSKDEANRLKGAGYSVNNWKGSAKDYTDKSPAKDFTSTAKDLAKTLKDD